jgi:hypothetical protein
LSLQEKELELKEHKIRLERKELELIKLKKELGLN